MLGNEAEAISYAEDAYERRPLIPLLGLVLAAAHADPDKKVGGTSVSEALDRLHLHSEDARRLPFADPYDAEIIVDRLRSAGAPE